MLYYCYLFGCGSDCMVFPNVIRDIIIIIIIG